MFHSLFITHKPVWPIGAGEKVHVWGVSHIEGMDDCVPSLLSNTALNGGPETILELTKERDFPGKGIEKPEHPPWGEYPLPTSRFAGPANWWKTDSLLLSPDQMHVLRGALQEVLVRKTRLQADWQLNPEEIHEANLLREVFWVVNVALFGYHHHACVKSSDFMRMGLGSVDAEALDRLDRLDASPLASCGHCHKVFGQDASLMVTLNEGFGLDGLGHYPLEGHPPQDSKKLFCSDECFVQFLREHPEI